MEMSSAYMDDVLTILLVYLNEALKALLGSCKRVLSSIAPELDACFAFDQSGRDLHDDGFNRIRRTPTLLG